jgi:hypothetical protein
VLEARPNAKRLQQIANSEAAGPRASVEQASTTTGIFPLTPQGERHHSVPNCELVLPGLPEGPHIPTDQAEALEWDPQWPFYGEGLQDANLDWTLDFLSTGMPTDSPLDPIDDREEVMHTMQPDISAFNQGRNDDQDHGLHDDIDDEPQAWLDQRARPVSLRNSRRRCETSGAAAFVDNDERNSFFENHGKLQVRSQLSANSHRAMMETVTAPLLEGFCSEKGMRTHSFPPHSTIIYFLQLYFVHVQPRFPVLHVPTFDPENCPSSLLLAMAVLGSSYSDSNQGKFALTYLERARMSIRLMQEKDQSSVRLIVL